MERKEPIKLYFFVTMAVFVAMVYGGIMLKDHLSDKLPSESIKEIKETAKEDVPEEIRQARSIFGIGLVIFVTLMVIFATLKIATKKRE